MGTDVVFYRSRRGFLLFFLIKYCKISKTSINRSSMCFSSYLECSIDIRFFCPVMRLRLKCSIFAFNCWDKKLFFIAQDGDCGDFLILIKTVIECGQESLKTGILVFDFFVVDFVLNSSDFHGVILYIY